MSQLNVKMPRFYQGIFYDNVLLHVFFITIA